MATKLHDSFAAVHAALEVPRIARRTVIALLVIHSALLAYSAYVHSPTLNEPAHLVAGLSHWKFGRFDVYNVNPPLVKMVAALPVMAVGYEEDWSGFYMGPGARPEMGMGEAFVAANGERSFFLFMIARWACIPFSWIGAITCYLWARDLYGRPSGVLACAIWCFEPNILAHASLITPDAHATALGLAACYTFWRWLVRPTWTQAALNGVVLGLAELAKSTLILFYPLWPLMWLVYRGLAPFSRARGLTPSSPTDDTAQATPDGKKVSDPLKLPLASRMTSRDWLREAGMLALRMVLGLYVLNLGYAFEGSFTQLNKFHFVSDLFTGSDTFFASANAAPPTNPSAKKVPDPLPPNPQSTDVPDPLALSTSASQLAPSASPINRFVHTLLGHLPVPFPKNYLLGIDIQQRDFEHYGRPSYLRGQWRDHGWWYYYLYACAIKVPLALWVLGLLVLARRARSVFSLMPSRFRFRRETPGEAPSSPRSIGERLISTGDSPRRGEGAPARDEFILLFPAIVIFAVVSSKTGFSEHMRYVLPSFPYFFIWVSQLARLWSAPAAPPKCRLIRTKILEQGH